LGGEQLAAQASQTAILAKADLLTDMVGEFPELQGIMGRYYAQHEKLDDDIAYAIEDHYKPRFAGDELPRNQVGICVALADKLETLVGMFGIGNMPTGDKDPFALRRHALGVIRMLVELDLPLQIHQLITTAQDVVLQKIKLEMHEEFAFNLTDLEKFIYERLAGYLREQAYTSQEIDAVLSLQPQRLGEVPKRLEAVRAFAKLPEADSLAAANKRVNNILKKARDGASKFGHKLDTTLLQEVAEIELHQALSKTSPKADKAFEQGDYAASLQSLAALKTPVDAFFDHVMVNAEDPDLRANRLTLLDSLHQAMNRVADISKLAA
jgi:glycyl-tRNA synthetase beta chain